MTFWLEFPSGEQQQISCLHTEDKQQWWIGKKKKHRDFTHFSSIQHFFPTKHHGKSLQKQHNFFMKSEKLQDMSALQDRTEIHVFILTVKQTGNPPTIFKDKKEGKHTCNCKGKTVQSHKLLFGINILESILGIRTLPIFKCFFNNAW